MPALNTSMHKYIVNSGKNPSDNMPVDMRVAHVRLLADMGISSIQISNTAPTDRTVLWWHKDTSTLKRYNTSSGQWSALTSGLFGLNVIQRATLEASSETRAEAGDLFYFYDHSAKDMKVITRDDLLAMISQTSPVAHDFFMNQL